MDEKDMMHGVDWSGEDLAGWYLSEKMDGARAYWDGTTLWSRGGISCPIPDSWRAQLPLFAIDCELYAGVGGRYRAGQAIKTGKGIEEMKLLFFDAPTHPGDWLDRIGAARKAWMKAILDSRAKNGKARANYDRLCWHPVEYRETFAMPLIMAYQARVKSAGGEGLMMRKPGLIYRPGRTYDMLKVKTPTLTGRR